MPKCCGAQSEGIQPGVIGCVSTVRRGDVRPIRPKADKILVNNCFDSVDWNAGLLPNNALEVQFEGQDVVRRIAQRTG